MMEDPFVVRKYVLLVLRPNLFLPENRPVFINTHRVLRDPGGAPLTESDAPVWTEYRLKPNCCHFVDSSDRELTEFDYISKRGQGDDLSVFSLLVNANSKLQAASKRSGYPYHLNGYIDLVPFAIKAIFYAPPELERPPSLWSVLSPPPDLDVTNPEQRSDTTTPDPSTQSHGDGGLRGQDRMNLESKDGSGVVEDHLVSDTDYEESGSDSEEGDMINGLTFPEMETVLRRVSDGTISDHERAEAAMLMLGMAGGQLLLFCDALLSLTPSARSQTSTGALSIDRRLHVGYFQSGLA